MYNQVMDMIKLREALEATWDEKTSYLNVSESGNPALGQCYPTSRVIQLFFPDTEIVEGEVWTGKSLEKHFWNLLKLNGFDYHIDFTWQQFPNGSIIKRWKVRDRHSLGDDQNTINRVETLHERVKNYVFAEKTTLI